MNRECSQSTHRPSEQGVNAAALSEASSSLSFQPSEGLGASSSSYAPAAASPSSLLHPQPGAETGNSGRQKIMVKLWSLHYIYQKICITYTKNYGIKLCITYTKNYGIKICIAYTKNYGINYALHIPKIMARSFVVKRSLA
jgi:hypothetical protein